MAPTPDTNAEDTARSSLYCTTSLQWRDACPVGCQGQLLLWTRSGV